MIDIQIIAGSRILTPADLPSAIGAADAYRELGAMVECLIDQMTALAADQPLCDLPARGVAFATGDHAHRSLGRFVERRAAA